MIDRTADVVCSRKRGHDGECGTGKAVAICGKALGKETAMAGLYGSTYRREACPVPDCQFVGPRQHARRYEEIERTVGRQAADEFDARHEAFMTCDDCGRTDGSHDGEVEH